jgi:hypothetical protein
VCLFESSVLGFLLSAYVKYGVIVECCTYSVLRLLCCLGVTFLPYVYVLSLINQHSGGCACWLPLFLALNPGGCTVLTQ